MTSLRKFFWTVHGDAALLVQVGRYLIDIRSSNCVVLFNGMNNPLHWMQLDERKLVLTKALA